MLFFQKLKTHWFIILAALALVTIIEVPVFLFPKMAGEKYQGINIPTLGGANVYEYLMRGKDVLEGHSLGSASLREGKENSDYYFSIAEYILNKPIYWLGLGYNVDVVKLYDVYNFLGIFAIVLLIYFLVLDMSGSKLLSAVTALFVVGGYSIVYNKSLFYTDFNIYGRAVFPYMGSLFFFVYLYIVYVAVISSPPAGGEATKQSSLFRLRLLRPSEWSRNDILVALAGLSFGLLFYIYFFAWTFVLAFTVTLFGLYLFFDRSIAKKAGTVLGIGLALGVYNIYRIFSFVNSPEGEKFSYFSWLVHGNTLIFSKIGFIAAILLAIFIWRSPKDKNILFMTSLIIAGWVALNQQIITGKILQYAHYYWFFIVPISIVISFYIIWQLLDIGPSLTRKFFAFLIVGIVFVNTGVGQYRSSLMTLESKIYDQNFKPLINALNLNSAPGVILAADDVNATLFTIYTSHDLFWYSFALMDKTSMSRAKEALFTYLYLNKNSRNDIQKYLEKVMQDQNEVSFYKDLYMAIEGQSSGLDYYDYVNKVSDLKIIGEHRKEIISELNKDYRAIFKSRTAFADLLNKYGINYIVWDKNKHPEWDLSVISGLQEIVSSNNIFLYQMK